MDPEAGWLAGVATRRWHLAVGNEGGDPYHRDMECETRARLRKVGRQWEVAFGRGERFYLADTLGAKYLSSNKLPILSHINDGVPDMHPPAAVYDVDEEF